MSKAQPLVISILLLLLLGGAVYPLLNRKKGGGLTEGPRDTSPPVVQVVLAESRAMKRSVRLSGTLKSGSEATLSPKQGGRVVDVYVQEGQQVRRGQTLVRLDASDIQRQAEQAAAGVAAARANLEKAQEGLRLKRMDVERRIQEARRGVEQARLQVEKAEAGIRLQQKAAQADVQRAQAGVDAAKSALAQARRGARPEQRRQAQIQVQQAERGVTLAKKNLDDIEFLYNKGGVPRVQLDQARESYQKAVDGLEQARAQLSLVEAGALPEEIAAAEAQVRSAEAALAAAQVAAARDEVDKADLAAARTRLAQAEDGLSAATRSRAELEVAQSDVRAARAAYEQALAASRLASQQLKSASVVSPVDGVVTSVQVNVGEMAGPGRPVATVVGTAGVYLEAAAPSRVLQDLRPGQEAKVTLDALPGRRFAGTVRSIGTVASPDGRSFPVQIDISAPAGVLKPGAFARAEIKSETHPAVSVPVEALRTDGAQQSVWVVREGIVVDVPVETPSQDEHHALLRGDIRPGEQVILSGTPGLIPGDRVLTRIATAR
jgi:RND family efflux transporter MFP subunit